MCQESLADRAVTTLAAVRVMCDKVEIEHPERQAIRGLKQIAENLLDEAFRQAGNLAHIAESLSDDMRKAEAAQAKGED